MFILFSDYLYHFELQQNSLDGGCMFWALIEMLDDEDDEREEDENDEYDEREEDEERERGGVLEYEEW